MAVAKSTFIVGQSYKLSFQFLLNKPRAVGIILFSDKLNGAIIT